MYNRVIKPFDCKFGSLTSDFFNILSDGSSNSNAYTGWKLTRHYVCYKILLQRENYMRAGCTESWAANFFEIPTFLANFLEIRILLLLCRQHEKPHHSSSMMADPHIQRGCVENLVVVFKLLLLPETYISQFNLLL